MRKHVATTQDIARHVGVSRATVSYVLNGKSNSRISETTREAVLSAATELKWRRNRIAEAMPIGRIYTIGVVIGDKDAIRAQYVKDLYVAISLAAHIRNLRTTLVLGSPEDGVRVNDLGDGRLDGIIAIGNFCTAEWIAAVEEIGLPCVTVGSSSGKHTINPPDEAGAYSAVRYLHELGHRRIAHVAGSKHRAAARLRCQGFLQAVRDFGLNAEHCPVVHCETLPEVVQGVLAVLNRPLSVRPTAVFAFTDQNALYALDAIRLAGLRVPDDISLIGYDNEITATVMRPQLTTIQNPINEIAEATVTQLQSLCDDNWDASESIAPLLPTRVIVRQSTAPPVTTRT